MTLKERIEAIKKAEERRLKEFPLYSQTKFKIFDKYIFVELERKRKESERHDLVKKVCQIIYDLNSQGDIMNAFDPLETSMKSYKKAFFVYDTIITKTVYLSFEFNEIYEGLDVE